MRETKSFSFLLSQAVNMFALTRETINENSTKEQMLSRRAGACATFEGRVRDINEGRSVEALEYEAYDALADKEGSKIVEEARARFDIISVTCIHRLGLLRIGDLAVWVGVTAEHRGDAFAACQYVIDEVKKRVPIWKNEKYKDGTSGWVNCAAHAHNGNHAHAEASSHANKTD